MAKRSNPDAASESPIKRITRGIRPFVQIQLFTRAGGRCEFDGCNGNVLEHPVTLEAGNFAEMAHIVAFKRNGPRGQEGVRPDDINAVENLMLLCPTCHTAIDRQPAVYPRERLEIFKKQHEDRVALVTSIAPDRKTAPLIFKAPIGGQSVVITDAQVFQAVLPRYPSTRSGTVLDLNDLVGVREVDEFLKLGVAQIDKITTRYLEGGEGASTGHLSIVALGPIPLLVHLGSRLSSKIPTDFFQLHRDTEDWSWKSDGESVRYQVRLARSGKADGPVAALLALSGPIPVESLPEPIRSDGWLYELTLEGKTPVPTFLRRREDLEAFRAAYQELLSLIAKEQGLQHVIDLIAAVPAPIAVLCGRDRLPKVHPALRVYDFDRTSGGYNYRIEVS